MWNTNIKYSIKGGFGLADLIDGKERHRDGGLRWGLEAHLNRDLSDYYVIEVFQFNADRTAIPGDAYVNGVKAEAVEGVSRGNYVIKKSSIVKEPLNIQIEPIYGKIVNSPDLVCYRTVVIAGEKAVVNVSRDFLSLLGEKEKPVFKFYKKDTDEEIQVKDFEFFNNPILPWCHFIMPDFDIDIRVDKEIDKNIFDLVIDDSGLKDIIFDRDYYDGVVSEAIYSDDYDFGIEDHYFYERRLSFAKGTLLKVEFYLKKKAEVSVFLGDEEYKDYEVREEVARGDDGNDIIVYFYRYEVQLMKPSTLWFKVN